MTLSGVRAPVVAGSFYSAAPEALRSEVDAYLDEATLPDVEAPPPIGFVSPHAGLIYSGPTAGYTYRRIRDLAPRLVVLVSPSHRVLFPGVSLWEGEGYATPLGEVPIDLEAMAALREQLPQAACNTKAESVEHALEVQLPFVQRAAPHARILPILMADQTKDNVQRLSHALSQSIAKIGLRRGDVVCVASSDGYHGHSTEECKASDGILAQCLESMEPMALLKRDGAGETMACGVGPIATVMSVAQSMGATKGTILNHSTSAERAPVQTHGGYVVGYTAAEFA